MPPLTFFATSATFVGSFDYTTTLSVSTIPFSGLSKSGNYIGKLNSYTSRLAFVLIPSVMLTKFWYITNAFCPSSKFNCGNRSKISVMWT
jgi:hypothetical protein